MKKTLLIIAIIIILVLVGVYMSKDQTQEYPEYINQDIQEIGFHKFNESLVGSWISSDDPMYEIIFSSEGGVVETYDGEETSVGMWEINEELYGELWEVVLTKRIGEETYIYFIEKLNEDILELIYLDRGNILSFSRTK